MSDAKLYSILKFVLCCRLLQLNLSPSNSCSASPQSIGYFDSECSTIVTLFHRLTITGGQSNFAKAASNALHKLHEQDSVAIAIPAGTNGPECRTPECLT